MATKVLMVCLGNICRSPLAEGIFRQLSHPSTYIIDSAGTANYHTGASPDRRSIAVASKNGLDISGQKARQLTRNDLDDFDHILVMDEQNRRDALALCSNQTQRNKIELLTAASGHDTTHIPDPYYWGEEGFESVFDLISSCCNAWLAKH